MEPGDRLIYYASVWRVVFAAVEVVSEPEQTRPGTRWPWTVDVEPLLVIPLLDRAPPVEAERSGDERSARGSGVPARSMSQQPHIRLSPHHFTRAIDAISSIAHP
jgi:hypothetical protein